MEGRSFEESLTSDEATHRLFVGRDDAILEIERELIVIILDVDGQDVDHISPVVPPAFAAVAADGFAIKAGYG